MSFILPQDSSTGEVNFNEIITQQEKAIGKAGVGALLSAGAFYFLAGNTEMNFLNLVNVPSYIGMGAVVGGSIYTSDTVREYMENKLGLSNDDMLIPLESLAVGSTLTAFNLINTYLTGNSVGLNTVLGPLVVGVSADIGADYVDKNF